MTAVEYVMAISEAQNNEDLRDIGLCIAFDEDLEREDILDLGNSLDFRRKELGIIL